MIRIEFSFWPLHQQRPRSAPDHRGAQERRKQLFRQEYRMARRLGSLPCRNLGHLQTIDPVAFLSKQPLTTVAQTCEILKIWIGD